jgi:phosphoribosylformimino-5-aminoimidazole carboxamide ribotide isomerase
MLILPAIDLLGGKVVRLVEGRRESATVYSDDPGEVARRFVGEGAPRLHVVDLDGAFAGRPENRRAFETILSAGVPTQLGGGVRDEATIERLVADGAARIVLGTAAVKDPRFVESVCGRFAEKIVVAVDARDGKVAVEGWAEVTTVLASALARQAVAWGAAAILYTDIARDGKQTGPNVAASADLARALAPTPVIASGGIGALADLEALAQAGLPEAIVGRALYEGVYTIPEALRAAKEV